MDQFNEYCLNLVEKFSPTEDYVINLKKSYDCINSIVKGVMEGLGFEYELVIYGSAVNGLAVKGDSDLDLTIVNYDLGPRSDE